MKNLVVGATGLVGSEICRLLAAGGRPPRALVRSTSRPERVDALRALGAEIAVGDLRSRPSLDAACRGVEVVFTTATAIGSQQADDSIEDIDLQGQKSLIDAAAAAGVKRFVYVSVLGLERNFAFAEAKAALEDHLRASGLAYTILQPSCFMDVWLTPHLGFDHASGEVTVYGDGQSRMRWVHSSDVARAAVAAAGHPDARNAVLAVGGPELLSPLEVIAIFDEVAGRRANVTHVPKDQLESQRAAAGSSMEQAFAGLMLRYAAGDPPDAPALPSGILEEPTSVRDFARRVLAG
jgi:NADH dehydrogenase